MVEATWGSQEEVKGWVLDERKAYRQIPILPQHRRWSVITLKDPTDGRVAYFVMIGHSFGLVSAVYNYNRRWEPLVGRRLCWTAWGRSDQTWTGSIVRLRSCLGRRSTPKGLSLLVHHFKLIWWSSQGSCILWSDDLPTWSPPTQFRR